MSVNINGTTITMTRGDTLKVKINIFDASGGDKPYIPSEKDSIRFAAKMKYKDETPIILKEIPYDTCLLHLEPNDTKNIKQPSNLVYDIQITMSDGTVDTFLNGVLSIKEEVD